MEQIMKSLVFLIFILHLSSAVSHSLQYFYTGVTPGINFPEFTAVGLVDGEQFMYYDSNSRRLVPKTEWIQKVDHDDADYWNRETQILQGDQETYKVNVQTAMQRFNQTKGVHTVQRMFGCELDDDGTKRGYMQDGFDGEDFISLDLNTLTWTAPVPQAVLTKHKWEGTAVAGFDVDYLENTCIEWLLKYVGYGRDTLERKVPPKVDLFQSESSPVVCHATGFFPKAVMISWQKNGEDLHEDVELRETVPNNDGTFQKRSLLTVPPEELKRNQYTCVVQHSSLEEDLVLPVSDGRVLSGGVSAGSGVLLVVGAVVAVLLLVIVGVGVVIWKKKKSYSKRSTSESISSTDSEQSRRDSEQSSRDSVQSTVSSTAGLLEDD